MSTFHNVHGAREDCCWVCKRWWHVASQRYGTGGENVRITGLNPHASKMKHMDELSPAH